MRVRFLLLWLRVLSESGGLLLVLYALLERMLPVMGPARVALIGEEPLGRAVVLVVALFLIGSGLYEITTLLRDRGGRKR